MNSASPGNGVSDSVGDVLDGIWHRASDRLIATAAEIGADSLTARERLARICRHLVGGSSGARALAASRLQAGLAERWGLRGVLSPPDDFPDDPVHAWLPCDLGQDLSPRDLAVMGWHAAAQEPFRTVLEDAFGATSRLALAALRAKDPDPRWMAAIAPHPLRLGSRSDDRKCMDCAWRRRGLCLQVAPPWDGPARVFRCDPACVRWEPLLTDSDCASCGACCREGYSIAPVRRGEAMLEAHPEWIQGKGAGACIPRPGGRCVALAGDGSLEAPWRCRDYAVRPRACSGLAVRSAGCLDARRRTGLSAG